MVRALLIAAALALTACHAPTPKKITAAADTQIVKIADGQHNPHAGVACAACHKGQKADVGRASVPREACTASGCHTDAGPPQVKLATAKFEHRNHAVNGEIAVSCAGCHTHDTGDAPLRASLDACALCHTRSLTGTKEQDCRLCHGQPKHTSFSSQGIPIAHAALPVMEAGCARCHYDVLAPQKKVSLETCSTCHSRNPDITRAGIARDLHPKHRGVQCTSCHQAGLHKIGAMSSAVNLQCSDCHERAHDAAVKSSPVETCYQCHGDAHRAQQRLVLGFVGDEPVLPSAKFLMGLTCRSCHVPPGNANPSEAARRGSAAACSACHQQEFGKVLTWWIDGARAREKTVGAYVTTAQQAIGNAPDTSKMLLKRAQDMLTLVREAGGQHNIELTDLVFRTSVKNAQSAYTLAGKSAPPAPELGNTPHVGTCSFCHYSGTEQWNYKALPLALHERLIKSKP